MSFNVILPHGRSVDLAETAVIRSVDQAESDRHNVDVLDYLKGRPNFDGTVPDTRWSVAIERKGQRPIYTTGSVKSLIDAGLDQRFDLIDGGRSAIAKGAKVHLIRPLAEREGSTARATIWVEGGSTNGLRTESDAATIKAELGARAGHLAAIGDEGFIDRARINRVSAFDPDKDLGQGQQRFTTAVRFEGVYRPQYFRADETALRGTPILDLRAGAPGRPGADQKRGGAVSAPEVR